MAAKIAFLLLSQPVLLLAQSLPQSFRIGERDGGNWYVTDVQPISDTETQVRFISVYPVCGTHHVNEAEYVFEASVGDLAKAAALCTPEREFNKALSGAARKHGEDYGHDQNISVQCGSTEIVHRLPDPHLLHFEELRAKEPSVAALFNLSTELRSRFSKETGHDVFHCENDCEQARMEHRNALEQAATDIISGEFDLVLPPIPRALQEDGQSRLSLAMPSMQEAAAGLEKDVGVVDDIDELGLEHVTEVPYPQMARIAHIQGDVVAELNVEISTGKVLSVSTTSGHPIFRSAVSESVKEWVFPHPYWGRNPAKIVVHFTPRCLMTIDTSQSVVISKEEAYSETPKEATSKHFPIRNGGLWLSDSDEPVCEIEQQR